MIPRFFATQLWKDNEEEMKVAFDALEAADPKDLDRAILAQTGMRKRPLLFGMGNQKS